MHIIKPNRLRCGDIIGICAPASPPASEANLNRGISYLEQLGFRIEFGKNVLHKNGYLAGSDKQRAADLNSLYANPKVKAIFTARGGYGSQRILPLLDYKIIKRNPKIFVGYSDITAIHFALFSKVRLVTFSGPMVAVEMADGLKNTTEERFWNMLMSKEKPNSIAGRAKKPIVKSRTATGRLLGGNLSIISSLIGTQYFPNIDDAIFILEEVDERPYRIDRMLQHMKLADMFKNVNGIALGDFSSCHPDKGKPSLTIHRIFQDMFSDLSISVMSGICYGHLKNSIPFPLGVRVKLEGNKKQLDFLESGVC
ncbi:MAG: LD-carboxypeptidase [Bacteroidota bacterium]|nr:LD-carboxypeptidase [Bacteroidota bacterium]